MYISAFNTQDRDRTDENSLEVSYVTTTSHAPCKLSDSPGVTNTYTAKDSNLHHLIRSKVVYQLT